jgi:hypothetical protein
MKIHETTGKQYCESREELAQRYFNTFGEGIGSVYAQGNMGIVTLLSDLQHQIEFGFGAKEKEYWRELLNDVKCVLIQEDVKKEEADEIHQS